ncbi:MAG: Crp/Fnr family transcriptional regulator [Ignavibacteria bacterium]|jgi:CRP-like cAMP-binding protein|nr:Crp/Fnr family transcriptional regulator [Ignavibacteria bacterium]MCU7505193.1 Crp/Fnr family transcriptional regulator [Ignavibacteria bacterium]MCU7518096.1 Crp/Fnr family transcriptional regulator [Ignavibacteria bacterium]
MIDILLGKIPELKSNWDKYSCFFREEKISAGTVLLSEGSVANTMYLIKKGCLRIWFNKDGKDITLQFFFEGEAVSSIESFLSGKPSEFTIESIEASELVAVSKSAFQEMVHSVPSFGGFMQEYLVKRLIHYAGLFLSRIRDNPVERYEDLIKTNPQVVQRIPQHFIASYLGITPVSLSRIRKRLKKIS